MRNNIIDTKLNKITQVIIRGLVVVIACFCFAIAAHASLSFAATFGLPYATGTSVSLGTSGLHGCNYFALDGYTFNSAGTDCTPTGNAIEDASLDLGFNGSDPSGNGASSAIALSSGTVRIADSTCNTVLVDDGSNNWTIYIHLVNLQVSVNQVISAGTVLGTPNKNVTNCGQQVVGNFPHVHFAFLTGSGTTLTYQSMTNYILCGYTVVSNANAYKSGGYAVNLQGLTSLNFTIPTCPSSPNLALTSSGLNLLDVNTGQSISSVTVGQSIKASFTVQNNGGSTTNLAQLWLRILQPNGSVAFDVGGDGNSSQIGAGQQRTFTLNPFAGFGLDCGHYTTVTNCGYGTYTAEAMWEDTSGSFHPIGGSSFTLVPGPSYETGQEVVVRNADGGPWMAFKTNSSNQVEFSFLGNQGWWTIGSNSPTFNSSGKISVVLNHSNVLEVFARDHNGNIWYSVQSAPGQGSFSNWYELTTNAFAGDPFAIMNQSNQVQVFARGSDNTMYTNWISLGGSWQSNWSQLTMDQISGDPVAIDRIDTGVVLDCSVCGVLGGTQLFALQNSNTIISYYSDNTGAWHTQTFPYSASLTDPRVTLSPVLDTLEIYSRSGTNDVWNEESRSGSWSGWTLFPSSPVNISGNPEPVIEPGGAVVVYQLTSNGTIYDTWNSHSDRWASSWYQQSTNQISGDPMVNLDSNPSADELWANFADGSGLYNDWVTNGNWSGWTWEEYYQ